VTTVTRETTLDEIQVGIKRRLETIDGLRASATETERPNLPTAYPRLVSWVYSTVFEGQADWVFDVWVIVGIEPDLSRAQSVLNAYLAPSGPKSVKCAIDADPSLSGCVSFARVVGGGDYGRLDIGGIAALGASVRVEVSA
jgi:hypothetical protein